MTHQNRQEIQYTIALSYHSYVSWNTDLNLLLPGLKRRGCYILLSSQIVLGFLKRQTNLPCSFPSKSPVVLTVKKVLLPIESSSSQKQRLITVLAAQISAMDKCNWCDTSLPLAFVITVKVQSSVMSISVFSELQVFCLS